MRLVLLAVSLAVGEAANAEEPTCEVPDPPQRAVWRARDGGPPSLLVPAWEVPALNVLVWAGGRIFDQPNLNITPATMWRNISQWHWVWDDDPFEANAIGHPYQGSLAFAAARSSGIGFWGSTPFAFFSSAMWEVLMESVPPSKNDLITTTVGGIVLGEMLHRLSRLVLDSGEPTLWRWLGASVLDPVGAFNMYFFGRKKNDFNPRVRTFARALGGASSYLIAYTRSNGVRTDDRSAFQAFGGLDVVSGLPGDAEPKLGHPFDHFVAHLRLGLASDLWAVVLLRGLLFGDRFDTPSISGLYGLFAGYNYANQSTLRVSTVSLGAGVSAQVDTGSPFVVMATAMMSGVPLGAAGRLADPVGKRDYQYGPGWQAHAQMQLVYPRVFRVSAGGTYYRLYGELVGQGLESVWYASFSIEAALNAFNGVGVELILADRSGRFAGGQPHIHQRSSQLAVYWSVMTDAGFGAVATLGASGE